MGILSAKCEQCWDTLPCRCERQMERDQAARNSMAAEQAKLLREQNDLLRQILKQQQKASPSPATGEPTP